MIIQCPSCRALVVVAQAALAADSPQQVGLQCSACQKVAWLPVSGSDAVTAPPPIAQESAHSEAPQTPVPQPQPSPGGLAPSRRSAPLPSQANVAMNTLEIDQILNVLGKLGEVQEEEEELAEAFIELLDHWDEQSKHKQLIKRAALEEKLAFAGLRYRAVLDARPDDPVALAAQEEILVMAMSTLRLTAPTKESRGFSRGYFSRGQGLLFFTSFVVVALALWFIAQALRDMP